MPPKKRAPESSVIENEMAQKMARCSTRTKQRTPNCLSADVSKADAPTLVASTSFSHVKCSAWFKEYCDPKTGEIGPDGMEKFCEDLGVEPENIVMLAIAWKMQAYRMGFFKREEWVRGMTELQCDTMTKLKSQLDTLRLFFSDPESFKQIYRYSFDFCRERCQRGVDIEMAREMFSLLLGRRWPLFPYFKQFLEQTHYKMLNKDQWFSIYDFSTNINTDLSNYDKDGAWPVLLDEFVEMCQMKFPADFGGSGST